MRRWAVHAHEFNEQERDVKQCSRPRLLGLMVASGVAGVLIGASAMAQPGQIVTWGGGPVSLAPPPGVFTQISIGAAHGLALRPDGTMVGWGDSFMGEATPQPGTFVQVAAGMMHSVALRSDGVAVSWGYNKYGQADTPLGTFVQVSAGYQCSGGVRTDGSIHIWGMWSGTPIPPGTFRRVSVGGAQSLAAIRTDGTMVTWANAPAAIPGLFREVNIGCLSSALREDGTVVTFGNCGAQNYPAPPGVYTSLSRSSHYPGAIRSDGAIAVWGPDFGNPGYLVPPPGRYSMVATGPECGFALTACYVNCDDSTSTPSLTANDFQCFLNAFASGGSYANCDGSTSNPTLTANDFQCFLDLFAAGCD